MVTVCCTHARVSDVCEMFDITSAVEPPISAPLHSKCAPIVATLVLNRWRANRIWSGRKAAVYEQRLAGNEVGSAAGEKNRGADEV